jgi:HEPN domain-containing protein
VEEAEVSEITDHQYREEGRGMPVWVDRYIGGGLRQVEELSQYQDKFVFISRASGANLKALIQWAEGFQAEQDLPRMVSARIEARFTGAAVSNPDEEYGRYFEALVKNAADAVYSSARAEERYWIKKRYFDAEGTPVEREEYDYYILVTTDREVLERQIRSVLNRTSGEPPPTREQNSAIERLKASFFEGF